MSIPYRAVVTFHADRELTGKEMDDLVMAVVVQVEEPADEEGERAAWSSSKVDVQLGRDRK